jgi:hypothetical protein
MNVRDAILAILYVLKECHQLLLIYGIPETRSTWNTVLAVISLLCPVGSTGISLMWFKGNGDECLKAMDKHATNHVSGFAIECHFEGWTSKSGLG